MRLRFVSAAVLAAVSVTGVLAAPVSGATPPIGGTPVDPSAAPWFVTVLDADEADPVDAMLCAGALVADDLVLTSGHCATEGPGRVEDAVPAEDLQVALGVSDLPLLAPADRRAVSEVIVYGNSFLQPIGNLALLRLATPVTGVEPIAVNRNANLPARGAAFTTFGFGDVDDGYPGDFRTAALTEQSTASGKCPNTFGFEPTREICAGKAPAVKAKPCFEGDVLVGSTPTGPVLFAFNWDFCWRPKYQGAARWTALDSSDRRDIIDDTLAGVPPSTISLATGDASAVEGHGGQRTLRIPVQLSGPSALPVTVDWRRFADISFAGPLTGTVVFAPGETLKWIDVSVVGNGRNAGPPFDEELTTIQTGPTHRALNEPGSHFSGSAYALDDDPADTPKTRVGVGDLTVPYLTNEPVDVAVTLSRPSTKPVTVDVQVIGSGGATTNHVVTFKRNDVSEILHLTSLPASATVSGTRTYRVVATPRIPTPNTGPGVDARADEGEITIGH